MSPRILSVILLLVLQVNAEWKAGAARRNITPRYPVMLSGYASRTAEATTAKVDLWAKALALSWEGGPVTLILTVDSCGVPAEMRAEVLQSLSMEGIEDSGLNICSTHTHSAPALSSSLRNLFGFELDEEKHRHILQYTIDLRDHLIAVSREALKELAPAQLEFGQGKAEFASNRRLLKSTGLVNAPNTAGPVDHDVPVLKVSRSSGEVCAVLASYACHCTTLSWQEMHPDWAGIAQLHVEMAFPHAVCLTAVGCGGDQNPYPRGKEDHVRIHGFELGKAIRHTCVSPMRVIRGPLVGRKKSFGLPFAPVPRKEELEKKAVAKTLQVARHAQYLLEMQQEGKAVEPLPYCVQTLSFSQDLAMVFLNGEVVVDYSLRLKRELDAKRLWVNAYANDVQAYIPSERVLKEGGYEAGGAMIYYLRAGPLAPGVEDKIIHTVKDMLPDFTTGQGAVGKGSSP